MRSAAFALTILLLSYSLAGCASDDGRDVSEDPISDIEREDLREVTDESTTITQEAVSYTHLTLPTICSV